jgi:hypothetical protein
VLPADPHRHRGGPATPIEDINGLDSDQVLAATQCARIDVEVIRGGDDRP